MQLKVKNTSELYWAAEEITQICQIPAKQTRTELN